MKRLYYLTAANAAMMLGIGAILLGGAANPKHQRFDEIDVERINIVGPDGKPSLVIARNGRLPGPRINGKEYPASLADGREHMAGMIFFNQLGDEAGGLVFAGIRRPDGTHSVVGHLSLDQREQNMVMALQHIEGPKTRRTGIQFIDRPTDISLAADFDRAMRMREGSPAEREAASAERSAANARGELGAQRIFLGSIDRRPLLQFKDRKGQLRAQMSIGEDDMARLEFYDGAGKLVATYPK